jgi:hypothetical protein
MFRNRQWSTAPHFPVSPPIFCPPPPRAGAPIVAVFQCAVAVTTGRNQSRQYHAGEPSQESDVFESSGNWLASGDLSL